MRKVFTLVAVLLSLYLKSYSQEVDSLALMYAEIESSLNYQKGVIELEAGNAILHVPEGFGFLDKEQSKYVLTDLWGNPEDETVIGLLVPDKKGVLNSDSWVYSISYDEVGYIEDDDAEDIDYDELLEEQQSELKAANPEREKLGYQAIELVSWASDPFYDKNKKILHWAKELNFKGDSLNTLNYNLRVLGRKGMFMINAIASMSEMPEVNASINPVINSVEFKEGSKYADFNPEIDKVASWTIGGLVAGKILAKVGFFAVLAKFWKLILLGIASVGGGLWKMITGKKEEEV
ncbi:DUF2167 domain-containing protein [Chondrinema litorale]|uniref:DUF2167 domain-containing protein n=1 Tax=Chondrinema litorale TaxID=2994555 RepID=UPI002543601F|nr:DUF2167 domain-containing protein [Chondrinema litorale]UZR98760.1 DUF2167 domain-containing protein [Chondrinema litorale]